MKTQIRNRRGAFTLVELMTTLMIFTIVATAAFSMMAAGANSQRYVLQNTHAVTDVELAFRRIVENIRSASQGAVPSANEIDLVTQPDTSKAGNPVYNVKYTLVGTQLLESDDRYGTNTLASNVSTFTISVVQATKPTMYRVTITATPPNSPAVTRQSNVTARNF